MKIAFLLPSLDNKGPNLIAKYIIDLLVVDNEVCVYYFDDIVNLDFPCETIQIPFFKRIPFDNFDVVHSHMLRPDLYLAFWSFFSKVRSLKVSTIHQESFKALSIQYNFFVAFVSTFIWNVSFLFLDKVVALNNVIKNQFWFLPKSKIFVIGNGIPQLKFYPEIPDEDKKLIFDFSQKFDCVLGSCCLLIKRKGLDQVIKSLKFLPDTGYIILGDGPEKELLIKLAVTEGVYDRCLFLGSRKDGFRYFSLFDLYMLVSHSEGHPISAIEASRIGLPIVCSKIDVLLEVFNDNETVFFDLNDINSLCKSIVRVRENKPIFSDFLKNKFTVEFTDKIMFDKYLLVYNNGI